MALAVLKYLGNSEGYHEFDADIGTSSFYQYRTGRSKRRDKGLEMVDEVLHQSALMKAPVSDPARFNTRFRLRVPENNTRDHRFIQLFSFRTAGLASPAVSEVVEIAPPVRNVIDDYKLPKIMTLTHTHEPASTLPSAKGPCDIRENKVSEAMFFNAILGAFPGLLTNALPLIGKIIPGLQKALPAVEKILPELGKIIPSDVKPGKEGVDQILQNISPETIKAIMEVVQSVTAKTDNSAVPATSEAKSFSRRYGYDFTINPSTLMQLAPLLEKVMSPETIKAIGDNPVLLYKAIADSAVKFQQMHVSQVAGALPAEGGSRLDKVVHGMALRSRRYRSRYSEAKVAPALLAALPALMPLLEKVANPEMIKAIGEQPVKLFNAVADAGLKHQKQEFDHLEKINPGVDDPAFDALVASMSAKSSVSVKAKFSNRYTLEFADVKTISIAGKEKVVYDRSQKMHIPLKVIASGNAAEQKGIPKAIVQVIIQDGDSMNVLLEKKFRLRDVMPGVPVQGVTLESDDLKRLPIGRDLKLEVSLNWKKGDKTEGTFKNHYICVSDGYVFQRPGKTIKQHFTLNDVARFRNYWHKVWEGGPETHNRWNIDFECKYYYVPNEKDVSIRKLETKKMLVSDSGKDSGDGHRRKISAKLKSGLEVSLAAYNELLSLHELQPLPAAQLSAFSGAAFMKESAIAARVSVDFKGKKGETAALWTYPEGNIQSYILGRTTAIDPTGMITALQEEEVFFPRFSTVHFIGTKSE
jgi:hypothetical protein